LFYNSSAQHFSCFQSLFEASGRREKSKNNHKGRVKNNKKSVNEALNKKSIHIEVKKREEKKRKVELNRSK
jgi:hypothetical protein